MTPDMIEKILQAIRLMMEVFCPAPPEPELMTAEEFANCDWCKKRLDIALRPWRRRKFETRAIKNMLRDDQGLTGRELVRETRKLSSQWWHTESKHVQDHELVAFCTDECCDDDSMVLAATNARFAAESADDDEVVAA